MIIYGINSVKEAIEGDVDVREIFVADRVDVRVQTLIARAAERGIRVTRKDRGFFRSAPVRISQDIAADVVIGLVPFDRFVGQGPTRAEAYLVLDQVEDPRNLGAILRSALACNLSGVVLQSHRACSVTPAVFSASAGAAVHMRIAEVPNIKNAIRAFRERGFQIVGTDAGGDVSYWDADFSPPTVLVIGSEGKGMRRTVGTLCDLVVSIPLVGKVSSLNVSVASALVMYELLRQRTRKTQGF